ncbi:uncharacterized protein N7459_002726 [Penicillium hispanicum]|uniref:uncharacterized protein n=1 Tax=Penicillium hispanicum TaxID=1080232 RepID=UPI0025426860|nr:uncharacterized protein N7459_002726 [Penicillium hispanicum]KAJ5586961.1 hypothetical protein N7459_002726 [Penicillium hispanicum]
MANNHELHMSPKPSALTKLIDSASASGDPHAATTIQILHNLQHQHLWTSLQIHDLPTPSSTKDSSPDAHVRTLISGVPPHRVYTHPDEQLYMLEQGLRDDDLKPERMFVIPTAQGQSWSLGRMAAVFDAQSGIQVTQSESTQSESEPEFAGGNEVDSEKAKKLEEYYARREKANATKEWGSKRMLLAMVDRGMGGDGTVVYYIVQEGEVKPRQN